MNYILGLLIATFSIVAALTHLNQGAENYYDFVAMMMVLGGTTAVAFVIFPWNLYRPMMKYFRKLLFNVPTSRKSLVNRCLDYLQIYKEGKKLEFGNSSQLEVQILKDGFELIELGFSKEKIKQILSQRIYEYEQFSSKISGAVRSLAKYPPAFGLAGTVFGMVELMKAVSEGLPAQETGIKMAIALVATLYGILVANMFINPAGEQITKICKDEIKMAEISLVSVLLAKDQVNLLECQESLNSFVLPNERVDALGDMSQFEDAA